LKVLLSSFGYTWKNPRGGKTRGKDDFSELVEDSKGVGVEELEEKEEGTKEEGEGEEEEEEEEEEKRGDESGECRRGVEGGEGFEEVRKLDS
jgi:hypothetical protein